MKISFAVSLLIAVLASTLDCLAFEPRFYSAISEPKDQIKAVFDTAATADRRIYCRDLDEIDVGIGEQHQTGKPYFAKVLDAKYFQRKEIHYFLESAKQKELLLVWFEKSIMWQGVDKVQSILLEFKRFVSDLGYQRVLILGAHAEGVYVVYDSLEKPNDVKRSDGK